MSPILRRTLGVLLLSALAAGTAGCGGSEEAVVSPSPSLTLSPTPSPSPTLTSASTEGPTVGLPDGFPAAEVPLLSGVVTGKAGGPGADGRVSWVLEMSAVGSQQSCFDRATARLQEVGFTLQDEIVAADTRQAQLTSADYVVIVSVRADGDELCQASYELRQVAG